MVCSLGIRPRSSCVASPAVVFRGELILNATDLLSTANHSPASRPAANQSQATNVLWPAFWAPGFMSDGVVSVEVGPLQPEAFGRLVAQCQRHGRQKRLLLTAVSRYGNHWHVMADSFMYSWGLLHEQGLLDPTADEALRPTIVLLNTLREDTKQRGACCVSDSPLRASVGPWTAVWAAMSNPREPLRTPAWLHQHSMRRPQCYETVAVGGSPSLDYYLPSRTEQDWQRRRGLLGEYLRWVRARLGVGIGLPQVPTDRNIRLLMVARRGASGVKRRIVNLAALIAAARRRPGLEVTVVDFARLPLREQIALTSRHDLYVGMQGTSMMNAMWLPAHGVPLMVLACGCSHRSNFFNLLRHGAPGVLYQFRGEDPSRPGQKCSRCALGGVSASVPLPCFHHMLGQMTVHARWGLTRNAPELVLNSTAAVERVPRSRAPLFVSDSNGQHCARPTEASRTAGAELRARHSKSHRGACVDHNSMCVSWAAAGYCTSGNVYEEFMQLKCPASCEYCARVRRP